MLPGRSRPLKVAPGLRVFGTLTVGRDGWCLAWSPTSGRFLHVSFGYLLVRVCALVGVWLALGALLSCVPCCVRLVCVLCAFYFAMKACMWLSFVFPLVFCWTLDACLHAAPSLTPSPANPPPPLPPSPFTKPGPSPSPKPCTWSRPATPEFIAPP